MESRIMGIVNSLSTVVWAVAMVEISLGTLIVFSSTILRYFFGVSFEWAEELLRYLIICAALIGSAPMIMNDSHIIMDFFSAKIKDPKLKYYHSCFSTILIFVCAIGLFIWGCDLTASAANTKSYSLIFPLSLPYSIVPISMAVMAVFCILKLCLLYITRPQDKKGGDMVSD